MQNRGRTVEGNRKDNSTHLEDGRKKKAAMAKSIKITTHEEQAREDRAYWRRQSPEARLDEVERLRIEAGKFLYEYPTRLRRVVRVVRKA